FVPTVGATLGRRAAVPAASALPADTAENILLVKNPYEGLGGVGRAYLSVLQRVVRHPGKLLLAGILLLTGTFAAYSEFGLGVEFFPAVEPTQAALNVRARGDFSVEERDVMVRRIEERIADMREFESIYTRTSIRFGSEEEEDLIG